MGPTAVTRILTPFRVAKRSRLGIAIIREIVTRESREPERPYRQINKERIACDEINISHNFLMKYNKSATHRVGYRCPIKFRISHSMERAIALVLRESLFLSLSRFYDVEKNVSSV